MLAVALYVRDVAGLVQEASPADLPGVVPRVVRTTAAPVPAGATAEWNAWWSRALATGSRAVLELQPPAFPAFADAPALQQLLREHFESAQHWSQGTERDHPERDHPERTMRSQLPLGELVDDVERALGRRVLPFTLRIDEVPVAGLTWRPVTDAHVLVSSALLRSPVPLFTLLRPAIQQLA